MITGIFSGKGGAGKTTVAINLAAAITKLKGDVILVDGNFETPHISIYLGKPYVEPNVTNLILNESLEGCLMQHPSGLQVVAGDITNCRQRDEWDFQRLRKALDGRTVILDMPPGINVDKLLAIVDKVIIVTTPDLAAVTDAYKTVKLCKKMEKKIIGVIINKYSADSMMSLENIRAMLDESILGVLPEEEYVNKSVKMRHPVVYSHPQTRISKAFFDIAKHLTGHDDKIFARLRDLHGK